MTLRINDSAEKIQPSYTSVAEYLSRNNLNVLQSFQADQLHELYLYVNSKCDTKCVFCKDWLFERASKIELCEWKEIIYDAVNLGCEHLHIAGGEPLIYKDIIELLAYGKKHIPNVSITSNGNRLPQLAIPMLESGITNINLTYYSVESMYHDTVCQQEQAWSNLTDGIRLLIHAKDQFPCKTRVRFMVTQKTIREVPAFLEFVVTDLKITDIEIFPILVRPKHAINKKQSFLNSLGYLDLIPNESDIQYYNEVIVPMIQTKCNAFGLNLIDPYIFGKSQFAIKAYLAGAQSSNINKPKPPCYRLWYSLHIHDDGVVLGCNSIKDNRNILGNIREITLKDIWKSEKSCRARSLAFSNSYLGCCNCKSELVAKNRQVHSMLLDNRGDNGDSSSHVSHC